MKRRLLSLLLLLSVLSGLTIPASADILWEPMENDYYWKHYEDMDYMDQNYHVPDGMTANLYTSPEGGSLVTTLEAGARLYVGPYGVVNGETWAVCYVSGDYQTQGWVRLGRLQKEYSHKDFMEDFKDSLTYDAVVYDAADLKGTVPTWTYPGSGVRDHELVFDGTAASYNDGKLECRTVYTDPSGGKWGYVGYYMGRCGWIYLEDLYNEAPPAFPQTPENTVTDTAPTEETPGNHPVSILGTILLAVLVIGLTGFAIYTLKRKKR